MGDIILVFLYINMVTMYNTILRLEFNYIALLHVIV